ncbi:ribonuclease HII [Caulobacter vibrioides]|uniref:Ribonuclease HII n=2 Tax=Caulobacter vibrioides TaxID=155892 RepID=RNH2_CAUVC|nr:ribonuclease HII [Caulobacter vibrioides]YP_002515758.1 ribonuclease HII [Caulobacter vibrioides NA1000]B8GZ34.1 RecName: Full=Ribonuclease HII; Short=RNase HII [Caulobacter vibrioides NA1000]P0CAW4.1 RecName: Full=Ribonuclease HII; Short=RNase HII [Caulobacter vibrioides CB15]ACL93850.1 ribonuclease HII [Caulobacter vibrioides NA1000]ATC27209.1 ribonuclease HII [Caulobacter vibrioides]QXZ52472.1 ribonuclease HII [Caulobacter vibrioides]
MPPGPDMTLELACGQAPVCGVDEAGRGPWAGPVSAGAVILDPDRIPKGLNDSKKLSAKARAALEEEIKDVAISWCVGLASIEEIAQLNILHAAGLAMRRAVEGLAVTPAFALVDGNYAFKLPCPVKTVIKGDSLSCSIAAASILAKEARDRIMIEADALYPGYGFAGHKGYHAKVHVEGLRRLGPSPIHRLGWAPVKAALAAAAVNGELDL